MVVISPLAHEARISSGVTGGRYHYDRPAMGPATSSASSLAHGLVHLLDGKVARRRVSITIGRIAPARLQD